MHQPTTALGTKLSNDQNGTSSQPRAALTQAALTKISLNSIHSYVRNEVKLPFSSERDGSNGTSTTETKFKYSTRASVMEVQLPQPRCVRPTAMTLRTCNRVRLSTQANVHNDLNLPSTPSRHAFNHRIWHHQRRSQRRNDGLRRE